MGANHGVASEQVRIYRQVEDSRNDGQGLRFKQSGSANKSGALGGSFNSGLMNSGLQIKESQAHMNAGAGLPHQQQEQRHLSHSGNSRAAAAGLAAGGPTGPQ